MNDFDQIDRSGLLQFISPNVENISVLVIESLSYLNFAPYEIFDFDVDEWINFGFDNFVDDLNVKTWIVRADRSTAEVAALKRFYTPQIRKQLATLIHRIEYDIDREENILLLKNFCEENQIFDDYLNDFIDQIVLHRERFNDL